MKRFIGVDLHKNRFTVCYLDEEGREEVKKFELAAQCVEAFKSSLNKEDEVAIEATTNANYFAEAIKGSVAEVRLINPLQFKVISSSVKKTDKEDAITIAKYLQKQLIPEIRMKDKEEMELSSLIGTRDQLVKLRTSLKNKIHNILSANGIISRREMFSSEKGLKGLEQEIEGLSFTSKYEVKFIIDEIRHLNEKIEEISEQISSRGEKKEGYKNLISITGIGSLSATILLSAIGKIENFKDEKKLAAYLGIVPRVSVSNESSRYGRITKMGNKMARTVLVQSTWTAVKYSPYLRSFYLRLKSKKGSGKAIIATARKLLGIIYRTLKNNWVFEDFNEFQLATNN